MEVLTGIPAWLQEEVASRPSIPANAVTVETYAAGIKRKRAMANMILARRVAAGELEKAWDGRKNWYWPKKETK